MNTPDNEAAIYAQAHAIAMMHKAIMVLEHELDRALSDKHSAQQQLDAERDQHGKIPEAGRPGTKREADSVLKDWITKFDSAFSDNDALRKERDELKASYAQAFADLQAAADRYDKLLHERDALAQSLNGAQSINQALQNENRHLQSLIDELEAERKTKEVQP